MYCRNCGTQIGNVRFCPQCGTAQAGNPYPKDSMNIRKPDNYLLISILAIFLNIPFGIISIIYSSKVDRLYKAGFYKEAKKASDRALLWSLVGIGLFVLFVFLYILLVVVGGVSLFGIFSSVGHDTFTL